MLILHLISEFRQLFGRFVPSHEEGTGLPRGLRRTGFAAKGIGLGFGPASGLGTVLVLASLALASGPARADDFRIEGEIHIDDLLVRGGYEQIAPVPRHRLQVDLWSDPESGGFVRVGQKVQLFLRTNEDCYVTLVSIDADGRARRLFPRRGDDGWVRAGRVQALPGRWDDYDLRFTGPIGEEYVFAVASLDPMAPYYPAWLSVGGGPRWDDCDYRFGWSDLFDSGWCVGDPIPEIYRFAERLVPFPHRPDTYAATWIRFDVGRRHTPVWRVCNDCGGRIGHGHDCGYGYFEITIGIGHGVCDFFRPCPPPRYRHVVCRTVEPIRWARVFRHEPVGRWRSRDDVARFERAPLRSRDGRKVIAPEKDREGRDRNGKGGMTPDEYRRMREREVRTEPGDGDRTSPVDRSDRRTRSEDRRTRDETERSRARSSEARSIDDSRSVRPESERAGSRDRGKDEAETRRQRPVEVRSRPEARTKPEVRSRPETRPEPEVRSRPEARPEPEVRSRSEARPKAEGRGGSGSRGNSEKPRQKSAEESKEREVRARRSR